MSPQTRRALRINDPVADGDACHVAQVASQNEQSGRLRDVAVQDIHANPSQPRKHFDDTSLTALADSIRERAVLQPIIIQPRPAGAYELVAGRASLAGRQDHRHRDDSGAHRPATRRGPVD